MCHYGFIVDKSALANDFNTIPAQLNFNYVLPQVYKSIDNGVKQLQLDRTNLLNELNQLLSNFPTDLLEIILNYCYFTGLRPENQPKKQRKRPAQVIIDPKNKQTKSKENCLIM